MIKLLAFAILFVLTGLSTYWLSCNSGNLTFAVASYEVEMPFVAAFSLYILSIIFFLCLSSLLSRIASLPNILLKFFDRKEVDRTISDLSCFIINYADSAYEKLPAFAKRLNKSSHLEPDIKEVINVLSQDEQNDNALLTELMNFPKARELALRKLALKLLNTDRKLNAVAYAQELWKLNDSENNGRLLIKALIANNDWQQVINFINTFKARNFLTADTRSDLLCFAYYKLAMQCLSGHDLNLAIEYAEQSIKNSPKFMPAYELALQILLELKEYRKFFNMAKNAWGHHASYAIARQILNAKKCFTPKEFYEKVKLLISSNKKHYESKLLLISAALNADDRKFAKEELDKAISLDLHYTQRQCLLMAEFYLKCYNNPEEALTWINAVATANNDTISLKYSLASDELKIVVDDGLQAI